MWGLGSREIQPPFYLLLLLLTKSHEVYTYEEAPQAPLNGSPTLLPLHHPLETFYGLVVDEL
jgi:hypothetical protein